MGASNSSISGLRTNQYLEKFSSKSILSMNDPFWNQLLSFTFRRPSNSADYRLLDESTEHWCRTLLTSNLRTGNLGALVRVFLSRSTELKASVACNDNIFTWQTYNALFILRCTTKYLIETIKEDDVVRQFSAAPRERDGEVNANENLLDEFFNSLVEIVVDVPVTDMTYSLHLEAVDTLLILLSVQMFLQKPTAKSQMYKLMMGGKCAIHACVLMKSLMIQIVTARLCPPELYGNNEGGSLVLGLASGLWSALTLGYGDISEEKERSDIPLADQSLLLVLVLSNHCTNDKHITNPYREALFSFSNSTDTGEPVAAAAGATFKLDYSQLFLRLCRSLSSDQTTLLLYLLLHKNQQFKNYVLARTDVELLVLPILRVLYHAPESNSHHIYMSLILLLILSEENLFNCAVHKVMLKNITWYTERSLSEISLGGLLILVVIRTIQYNMTKMRDKYLHTNCLAALANMSSEWRSLHPYVAQRLVSLFALLARRHARAVEFIRQSGALENCSDEDAADDVLQDVAVLEEVLRMVLEIINSCVCSQLCHNPNLLYTLLYNRDVFEPFRTHPIFQDLTQNIDTFLNYLSEKLATSGKDLDVSVVLSVIQQGAAQFPQDRLKKFPELKFRYVEEEEPEEFFIPYVWSLVYKCPQLYWSDSNIRLFNLSEDSS